MMFLLELHLAEVTDFDETDLYASLWYQFFKHSNVYNKQSLITKLWHDLWISHIAYTFRGGLAYNYPIYVQCANTKVTMTNLTIYFKTRTKCINSIGTKCQQNVEKNKLRNPIDQKLCV